MKTTRIRGAATLLLVAAAVTLAIATLAPRGAGAKSKRGAPAPAPALTAAEVEARAAYLAAVALKYGSAMDEAAAAARLADVAKRWPDTAYGRRAKDELDPSVTTFPLPTPMLIAFVPWFLLARSIDSMPPPTPAVPDVGPGVGPSPDAPPPTEEAKKAAKKAREYLEHVKKESLRYFKEPHAMKDGTPLPMEFPPGASATPASVPCGKGAAKPAEKVFKDSATWSALKFVPDLGLPFTYEYRSGGQDEFASFEFTIRGDVDCDGYYSEFRIAGRTDGTLEPVLDSPVVTAEFE